MTVVAGKSTPWRCVLGWHKMPGEPEHLVELGLFERVCERPGCLRQVLEDDGTDWAKRTAQEARALALSELADRGKEGAIESSVRPSS